MAESYLEERERLRNEGKVKLPLNVDTKKYLFLKVSYWDLVYASPAIIISLIGFLIIYRTGNLNVNSFIGVCSPTVATLLFLTIKDPIRKNLSMMKVRMWWKLQFFFSKKKFHYQKGEMSMKEEDKYDVRWYLGIKNVFEGCYITTDNRLVKAIEVSSINLSLMNERDQQGVYSSFQTFLKDISANNKEVQLEQIAQPVNLSQYLMHISELEKDIRNPKKRMLINSYKKYAEDIQKTKDMVTRKNYIIISEKISSDINESLRKIEHRTNTIDANIKSMLRGYERLETKILNNSDLIKLFYTTIDYDNSQSQGEYVVRRAENRSPVTLGKDSAQELVNMYEKELNETIH